MGAGTVERNMCNQVGAECKFKAWEAGLKKKICATRSVLSAVVRVGRVDRRKK